MCSFYVLYYSLTEQTDFTDWMSFPQFNLSEEIKLNTEALSANT